MIKENFESVIPNRTISINVEEEKFPVCQMENCDEVAVYKVEMAEGNFFICTSHIDLLPDSSCFDIAKIKYVLKSQNEKTDSQKSDYELLSDDLKNKLNGIRTKCETRKLPFDLTLEDMYNFYARNRCECCGTPFRTSVNGHRFLSRSLDRIIPAEGYTKNNIGVICTHCNSTKHDKTLHDLQRKFRDYSNILRYYYKKLNHIVEENIPKLDLKF